MIADELLGRFEVATAADMEALGERIGSGLVAGDLIVLTGPLGAGKTTLTRGIASGLGVRGPVQSPTFVIARTHPSLVGGAPLVHADAYRLDSALELDDLDVDVDGSATIVEWGRGKVDGLRDAWWDIEIERPSGMSEDGAAASPEDLDLDAPRVVTIAKVTAP